MTTTIESKSLFTRRSEVERELAGAGIPAICSAENAMTALGLECERSIHRLIARREIHGFKVGNRWRVRRSELARLIARREAA